MNQDFGEQLVLLVRVLHRLKRKRANHPKFQAAARLRQNTNRKERHAEIIRRARSQPCTDCGRYYGTVHMEFDHRAGETKRFCVSEGKWRTKTKLLKEIAKCDVVCCECHEKREVSRGRNHGDNKLFPCPNLATRGKLPELNPCQDAASGMDME